MTLPQPHEHMAWRRAIPQPTARELAKEARRKTALRRASVRLGRQQLRVLQFLYRYQADHGKTPKHAEISNAIGRSHTSVSMEVAALERKGFITRPVKGEGRRSVIRLTAKGVILGRVE